jgi:hypothetical protein
MGIWRGHILKRRAIPRLHMLLHVFLALESELCSLEGGGGGHKHLMGIWRGHILKGRRAHPKLLPVFSSPDGCLSVRQHLNNREACGDEEVYSFCPVFLSAPGYLLVSPPSSLQLLGYMPHTFTCSVINRRATNQRHTERQTEMVRRHADPKYTVIEIETASV